MTSHPDAVNVVLDPNRFWNPSYQEWLTQGEAEYRKMVAKQQTLVVRETEDSLSQWQRMLDKARRMGK